MFTILFFDVHNKFAEGKVWAWSQGIFNAPNAFYLVCFNIAGDITMIDLYLF